MCAKNYSIKKKYADKFKKEIIVNFVKLVDNNLEYKNKSTLQLDLEYKCKAIFESKNFNTFSYDDCIEGKINGVEINLADICVQNITGSGKNRNVEDIFSGIFAISSTDKVLSSPVKIGMNKLKFKSKNDRVEMDSIEFEEYFDIYSEDRILATRVLTADVMEILIDFCKKYNIEFEILLKSKNIYLRFFTGPMFEPKIFKNSMNKEVLYFYYSTMNFVTELTKSINKVLQEIDV